MPCWAHDMSYRHLPYCPGGNSGLESRTVEERGLGFLISQSVFSLIDVRLYTENRRSCWPC